MIAIDRFSKWPTVKTCKTAKTEEVINFLTSKFNLNGIPEKNKSDKGGAFISKEYREFCKSRNIEIENCTPRLLTGNGAVERAIQTLKNLMITNLEEGIELNESINRALRVMRFTIHTGLKRTPFELHHGRKPRTELTNIVKDGKTYLSDWSEISISAPNKPKIPIYVGRDADGEITNHIIMAKTKAEEKQAIEGPKSTEKKSSVRYSFQFVEKNHNKKSPEGRFRKKKQAAIDGTENTVNTDTGKIIHRKFISGPLFQTEKKNLRDTALTNAEITPKNRHCLRGLDGKYGRWDEILRDILNGKLKIVRNRKVSVSETEDEDDDDDEEMPEETGSRTYDTSERNGRNQPIRTNPEEDVIQIHTDGDEIPQGENTDNKIRRSSQNINKPNKYSSVPYTGNFWG